MKQDQTEKKRAAFHHVGCKVNSYEIEKMKQLLEHEGYEIVPFDSVADVYVINTCSVTAIADKKSRQMLRRARRRNPGAIVVAAGCYVQRQDINPEDLECDIILGNDMKHTIVEQLKQYQGLQKQVIARLDINRANEEYEDWTLSDTGDASSHTRAFIKIQDGCDQFCTYCTIPYLRGRTRSRSKKSIIEEIRRVTEDGYKEAVFTGIHISSYNDEGALLADLCHLIDAETDLKRLRLGSLEPRIVTEDFVKRISKLSCICPHFHLSLQSGSDSVIKRMNRGYTTEEFKRGVGLLREYFDNPAITCDVIAGFPGESEEEFEETKEFVRGIGFYEMHVFPYSKRAGTKAAAMTGQLSNRLKSQRAGELIELAHVMTQEYLDAWKGKNGEVLWEKCDIVDDKRCWSGYTREYIRLTTFSEENLENTITTVEI